MRWVGHVPRVGEDAYWGLSGNLKERDHLENAEVDRLIRFKMGLKYELKA
jgi:hypothetical protein